MRNLKRVLRTETKKKIGLANLGEKNGLWKDCNFGNGQEIHRGTKDGINDNISI
jgi:hypothetical protein